MPKQLTLEINKRVGKLNPGDTITIDIDENGTPLDKFWRRRLYDSKIDHCVTVQKKRAVSKQTKIDTSAEDNA